MINYDLLAEELLCHLRRTSSLELQRSAEDYIHGEIKILTLLCENDTGISPGHICSALEMTTPRISAALASLEKKEYITRRTDEADKRRLHVYVTDSGRGLVEKKKAELSRHLSGMLSSLGEEDASDYVRIIGRICENAGSRAAVE